ncbi:IS30 family transposase [Enterocloster clostridioformis]|uniref:IS30 family transposase n=1 Tax=Enterocloster clostridioformis TaxID=1531 RepID=UPI00080C6FC8|nr:IS30 family transposase [Enterocloster clostridioformis]ANU48533.1 IS30 family transposase [Lachnoclostridium sp. YL32]WAK79528.1 transposase [Clostridium phage Saumur]NDO29200.1 IS30 family transposase [Enterocloster clostridioformis]OXE68761.1 IS30 family transposase [Enterocloster clostridioformis]QQR02573.1 IS30 family transposase [Enterocloster clostridioformis]
MKKFKQLSHSDRIKMETLLNKGHSKREVAEYLHVHRSTIYREYDRGKYMHRNSDYTEEERYSSDLGQKTHDWNEQGKGRALKIGNDRELAECIEDKIVNEKYSPEAALAEIAKGEKQFKTTISVRTLYRYIDNGIFLKLTNKELPIKGNRKEHNKKVRVQKRASAGESIENRPEEVKDRENFGHWEMDTVKGKRGVTKSCMLVLTERKTRDEIVMKLKDQCAASVVEALDRLERKWGDMFKKVFRSITVDNGVEFADYEGMEKSVFEPGSKRTFVFYCHPYSSWERGSNENNNRLIRRHIPKGTNFDDRTDEDIEYIENWINNYPRGIFEYQTSAELFEEELRKLA